MLELEASIRDLRQEEHALQLQLKAVRGKIAAAQRELMGARGTAATSAPAVQPRERSRSRDSHADSASGSSSSSSDEEDGREDAATDMQVVAVVGGSAAAAVAAPPPEPPSLAIVVHRGGRGADRGRGRGRGRVRHAERPAGRCQACWYRHLGVAGAPAHTGGEGCDRRAG